MCGRGCQRTFLAALGNALCMAHKAQNRATVSGMRSQSPECGVVTSSPASCQWIAPTISVTALQCSFC